jgi:hypothetical protein
MSIGMAHEGACIAAGVAVVGGVMKVTSPLSVSFIWYTTYALMDSNI